MKKYKVRLGVEIFNMVIIAENKSEAIAEYIRELLRQDAIIVVEEDKS